MPKITWIFIDIAKFLLQILTGQWEVFYCTDEECKGMKYRERKWECLQLKELFGKIKG